MNSINSMIIGVFSIFLISCSVGPKPIVYNEDQCASCKMLISDQRFGAELVTKKGRVYKYDAIECMAQTVAEKGEDEYAYLMVTDYHHPGELINAKEAKFIIEKDRPSPMGAFLSAYSTETEIEHLKSELAEPAMNWSQMVKKLSQ